MVIIMLAYCILYEYIDIFWWVAGLIGIIIEYI